MCDLDNFITTNVGSFIRGGRPYFNSLINNVSREIKLNYLPNLLKKKLVSI